MYLVFIALDQKHQIQVGMYPYTFTVAGIPFTKKTRLQFSLENMNKGSEKKSELASETDHKLSDETYDIALKYRIDANVFQDVSSVP